MFLHSRDLTLLRVARRSMATTFEIAFPAGTPHAFAAGSAALDLIEEIEEQLTVYRDTGEVARLNATAADGPVAVTAELFRILERCAAFTLDTAGAFDIAVGALVDAWSTAKREGRIPTPQELNDSTARSGFRHVMLNPLPLSASERGAGGEVSSSTVQFRRAGLKLNFGAVGKGYALDRAAELLRREWGIESALLQGGGSSMFGLGAPPNDLRGWPVALRHPEPERPILGTVYLKDRGFGTSAATFQFFEFAGKKYGHVLDPRTGRPVEGTESASCIAESAAEADAISTAIFVAGTEWATEFCRSRPHLGAAILARSEFLMMGEV
jgi:thiamine biosynthesis lipoprotein